MRTNLLFSTFEPLIRKDLKHDVIPSHYDLHINMEKDEFNGSVTMHLNAENPVKSFKFNSKNLKLSDLNVLKDETTIPSSFEEKNEIVTVFLEKEVQDDFKLSVLFSAPYSLTMEGFYKSEYNEKNIYSTHFEATDARKAFPCFDQPDMKATFSISIKALEGTIALSNNEVEKQEGNLFVFEKTPKMSTYIVAFVVGELDYIEDNSSKIPIRVYADASEKELGRFALDVAVRCLKYFENYFGIKYPMKKLDMVAIPAFAMGAMENWGLVTYRRTSLLFDEKSTSIRSKKNIANTVCHELAHMWFGNLVTMKWWSDLWLNEGFATWAATLAIANSIQEILPSDAWTNFVNDDMNSGMEMDSIKSTHMIGIEVGDPAQIDQIFDAISYDKGSSVIRMLENWLGSETFRLGLVYYLKKFQYKNAVTHNLWDSLSHIANKNSKDEVIDVSKVIDPWIKREGFPYIKVEDLGDSLRLTQERFTVGYAKEDEPWPIPVNILWIEANKNSYKTTVRTTHLLTGKSMEINKKSNIYKLNDEVSGFYRVLYPESYANTLLEYDLSPANRLNIYSDVFTFALATIIPLESSFELLENLIHESNFDVLWGVMQKLIFFRSIFYDNEEKTAFFNKKITEIVQERYPAINLKASSRNINSASTDSLVIAASVDVGYEDSLKFLRSVKVKDINPEYMRSHYKALVDINFKKTFEVYTDGKDEGLKLHALVALGTTTVEENIDFLFKNLTAIKPHEMFYLFSALGSNLAFRHKIVDLFIENYELIKQHISNASILRNCLQHVLLGYVSSENKNLKVLKFLKTLESDRELDSAVKKTQNYIDVANTLRGKYASVSF